MTEPKASVSGAEIRQTRAALGMSQAAFAALLGYSRKATISELENGHAEPTPPVLVMLVHLRELVHLRRDVASILAELKAR